MYKALIPMLILAGSATAAAPQVDRYARQEAQLAKRLDGLVQGPSQDCISPSPSRGGTRYGNATLIEDRTGKLYLTRFEAACTLDPNDAVISRRPTDRLCRGEIVRSRDLISGVDTGSCIYGNFVSYERPRR